MARFGGIPVAILPLVLIAALTACGSSPTRVTQFPVPANVTLTPTAIVSMDLGETLTFTGGAQNNRKQAIIEPIFFQSSNPAVLTIATNGNACAGSWDSLTAPQICTPGAVGVAQVTAFAKGVSSPPTTVYVHQHIDNITITPIPGQIPPGSCFSKGAAFNFQATAYSRGLDITAFVGTFTWQALNTNVVTLNVATQTNQISGLLTGQAQLTAKTPGVTSVFASASNVISVPMDFTTCAVQSITLAVSGGGSNTVIGSTAKTITATVVDSQGVTITGVPLSWCSSDPALVAAGSPNCNAPSGTNTTFGSSITATPHAGGATVIATCTPPNCNIGLQPTLPIYPENVVNFIFTSSSTTLPSSTIYVSSTQCGTNDGCVSTIIPITGPANTLGTAISLPATPNSLVWDPQGNNAYLGTDFSFFGAKGLMKVGSSTSGASVAQFKSVTGKVLVISPDSKKVILSGVGPNAVPASGSNPTQVIVFDTTSNTSTTLPIAGATAAAFSPDALKAYIAAGSTLYVYSTVDPLQTMVPPLNTPANDVTFLANGAFAYVAGGSSGVTSFATCDNSHAAGPVPPAATPSFLKSLPDASGILAVDSPNIEIISVQTTPVGCPPTVSNGPVTSFPLAAGNFAPTQMIVSPDGRRAYVLTNSVGSVLVFDIVNRIPPPPIGLAGSALPLHATLTPDGTRLYVAAGDGTVHVLDTQGAGDIQQISFPTDQTTLLGGLCTGVTFTCKPDLIAVKP